MYKTDIYRKNNTCISCAFNGFKYKYRGSYKSAHVLLNVLNCVLEKEMKCEACLAFDHFFLKEFNKFCNKRLF